MELIFGITALLFTLIYYYTASMDSCWYRRYLYPAMFVSLGFLAIENIFLTAIFFAASYFSFYGFKGLGVKALEEKKAENLLETKEEGDS